MKIELSCSRCGSNHLTYPFKLSDESMIACSECHHEIGTVAELQQKVIETLARGSARQSV